MASHIRKRVAQVGVVLFVGSLLSPAVPVVWDTPLPLMVTLLGGVVLLAAALIPGNAEETWGSMWPLVGYDNAIDGLYVRGSWRERFEEMDEVEAQKRRTTAMRE